MGRTCMSQHAGLLLQLSGRVVALLAQKPEPQALTGGE
jgi:hypothetical protein